MKILVTGASGFIGGYLVEELVNKGYSVKGMVRRTSNISLLKQLDIELVYADLTQPETLVDTVKDVDVVIHLAAYYTFFGKRELYELVNVKGTEELAKISLKNNVKRFIYCSSTEAIGPVSNPPGDETTKPNPQFEYGKSKLLAELKVKELGNKGLNYTIIRPSGIYGPRNVNDVSYWFVTTFAKGGLASKFIIGSGENLVQFAHVKDVINGFILVLEKLDKSENQTYIISEDKAYTYLEVYRILSEILGVEPPRIHLHPKIAKILLSFIELYTRFTGNENFMYRVKVVDAVTTDRAYSIEKARRELGYTPKYDLRTGLKETIEWYREHGYI